MLKRFKINDGKLVENDTQDSPVLLYTNPDETEKRYLIDALQIDEHTLNSALDPDELGRVEFETNHAAVIIKRPKRYSSEDNFLLKISSVGLFLFNDKIVIVLSEDAMLFDGKHFQRLRSVQDVLLKVIQKCIVHFEQHLHVIQQISDELEREINKAMANKDLLHMFNLEKSLVYYLKAIGSNGKAIEKLKLNSAKINFTVEENEFLEDVLIENSQCYDEANTYSQVLSSMMDAWVSIVSNNLNILIKNLTIVMICIMLPTLVIGIFSMNLKLPLPQDGTLFSFWIVMLMALFSVALTVIIYKRMKI